MAGLAYGALSPSSILITSDLELLIEITPVEGLLEEIADEARTPRRKYFQKPCSAGVTSIPWAYSTD